MRSLLPGDFISQRRLVEFCDRLAVQAMINSIIPTLAAQLQRLPVGSKYEKTLGHNHCVAESFGSDDQTKAPRGGLEPT